MRTHQRYGEYYKEIERVKAGHELIGEYVVVVTIGLSKERANRLCAWENEMVSKRGEDSDMFKVEELETGKPTPEKDFYVTRKLCVGDQVEFIHKDLI